MATFTEEYSDYLGNAKRLIYKKGVLFIDTPLGDLDNKIPASLFGLKKIYSVNSEAIIEGGNLVNPLYELTVNEEEDGIHAYGFSFTNTNPDTTIKLTLIGE